MNKRLFSLVVIAAYIAGVSSCKKDTAAPTIIPSDGTSQTLSGGVGGANAYNSVFLDLSTDKQTSIVRNTWDLGFYCGADFKVIINNTTWAKGIVLTKTDLAGTGSADTVGISFAQSYSVADYTTIDTITGDMSKTVIPTISATDASNRVVILNLGDTAKAVPARPLIKLRVIRNGSNGYTVQYAGITETTFKTITVTKDDSYNYKYVSFTTNGAVNVEPQKSLWDFEWTYALYQTPSGASFIPYAFSDMILINNVGGTTAAEVLNSRVSYANYADSSIANTTFSNNRHIIGSNWRSTQPATGVKTDRFYVLKDILGNVYKIKFNSMGAGDGGSRGYPQLEYKLVRKG
jgi:hypothetical protein